MKNNFTLNFALLLCLFWVKGNAQIQFWSDTFDNSPTSGIRTPEENGGVGGPPNTSYFRLTDGSTISQTIVFTGKEGSSFWAGEDHNAAGTGFTSSGAQGAATNSPLNELSITWTGINISGKTGLSFRGLFAANSTNEPWDNLNACNSGVGTTNTDYIIVQYRIDGGPYTDLIRFFNRGSATNGVDKYLFEDTDGNGCGDGIQLTNVFGEFIKTIPSTGTTLEIKINVYSEGNNEEWAIDNFRLFETPTCTAPTITANPPNRAICAGNNTTFSGSASGATAYQWQENTGSGFTNISNGGIYSGATTPTLTLTGVTAGMSGYLYRLVAINGVSTCFTNSNSGTLTVSNIFSSGTQTNVACNGLSNGVASVIPNGGIGGYTYSWSPSGGTGSIASGLSAGSYTVTITDAIGCTATRNFTITQPPALNGSTVVTNIACFGGNTGAINLTPTGGTPPYTFNWGGGITTEDRTGLTAGTYSVTITDANSCTRTINVTVTQPSSAVSGTTVVTNLACFGGSNGAINLTPTGGTGPYTFNWAGGITTEDRTGLAAGTYSVTITDANACTGTLNVTVTQPTSAVSGTTVVTNVACFGGSNGAINLTPTGGTGPYTFNWVSGPTTEDRTGLTAGTYSVTITDANGCTGTISGITVTQPTSAVSGTTVVTNVACFGGSNGAINLTPTGGIGPYTFNWVSGPTTEDRTGLAAGTYSVTITDANGCSGTISGITVTQPASAVSGTTVVTNVACFGGSNGAINLTPTGGTGPYTFNWVSGPTTEDRTGLAAGTYSVTITDANGCTGTISGITVTQPISAVSGTTVVTNVACFGGNTGAINLTPTGGTGPYTFNWAGGITTEDRTGLAAGTYSVTITDANGCTGTISGITVTQPAIISLTPASQTNIACFGGSNGAASVNTASGGAGGYTYDWTPGNPIGDGTTFVTGLTAGTWTCTVTDANGCTASQIFNITEPSAINTATGSQTNVSCNGGSNGTATVAPSGGASGYTYSWAPSGGTSATATGLAAGTYTVTVTDANGCTATRNYTITEPTAIDTNVTLNSGILEATQTGATYQWIQCPNTVLTGETNQTYTPTIVGDYKVEITLGGCVSTSSCVTVTTLANESFDSTNFTFYPNPTSAILNISYDNIIEEVQVFNLLGQQLITNKTKNKEVALDLSTLPAATYFVKIISEGKSKMIKIVKN